jgi:hypothetical protein
LWAKWSRARAGAAASQAGSPAPRLAECRPSQKAANREQAAGKDLEPRRGGRGSRAVALSPASRWCGVLESSPACVAFQRQRGANPKLPAFGPAGQQPGPKPQNLPDSDTRSEPTCRARRPSRHVRIQPGRRCRLEEWLQIRNLEGTGLRGSRTRLQPDSGLPQTPGGRPGLNTTRGLRTRPPAWPGPC